MIPKEILQKVRRIEITTSRMVNDVFAGQYQSVFKGRGIEFDEVREYQMGDDVRSIDWNVTARMGHPYIKKFVEERELTVMLVLDASMSSRFGSGKQLKSQLAAELCSILAFSAIKNNDKVGLIIFTDRIERFIPPRKGPRHVLRVVREALYNVPQGRKTDISAAAEYLNRVMKRRAVTFVISDFFDKGYERPLSIANKKHDIIAITVTDPRESVLPDVGIVRLRDAETGEDFAVDTSRAGVRRQYETENRRRVEERNKLLSSMRVDRIDVSTGVPYMKELIEFFRMRERRAI